MGGSLGVCVFAGVIGVCDRWLFLGEVMSEERTIGIIEKWVTLLNNWQKEKYPRGWCLKGNHYSSETPLVIEITQDCLTSAIHVGFDDIVNEKYMKMLIDFHFTKLSDVLERRKRETELEELRKENERLREQLKEKNDYKN